MTTTETQAKKTERGMEGWWLLGFLALWFVLQLWILPKMGVPT